MALSRVLPAQVFKPVFLGVIFTLVLLKHAFSSSINVHKYPSREYAVANRVYEIRDYVKSSLHCTSMCLAKFGSECRAVAYSEDISQSNCILISTRIAVTGRLDISSNYTLYSTGSCANGYKLNPNTGTCVGLGPFSDSWHVAKGYCEHLGEHLVTLPTIQDAEWLVEERLNNPDWNVVTWIGGYRERNEPGQPWYWRGRVTDAINYTAEYWHPSPTPSGLFPGTNIEYDCMIIITSRFTNYWCSAMEDFFCEADMVL